MLPSLTGLCYGRRELVRPDEIGWGKFSMDVWLGSDRES